MTAPPPTSVQTCTSKYKALDTKFDETGRDDRGLEGEGRAHATTAARIVEGACTCCVVLEAVVQFQLQHYCTLCGFRLCGGIEKSLDSITGTSTNGSAVNVTSLPPFSLPRPRCEPAEGRGSIGLREHRGRRLMKRLQAARKREGLMHLGLLLVGDLGEHCLG
jgi:hypothetical protein